ncbi:MAG TPA: GlsB/YeaQ/YmgE family stress response membrane protein [Acidimicrobiales bacterium]|jgi:uncharacterized membrane protein YeaQ/YmgE (transglycosylase-associated protein family)
MSILAWLVVGFVAGALARWVTGSRKRGCLATIAVGIVGAFIGGAVYRLATGEESSAFDDFDLGSVLVAVLGAVLLLLVLDTLDRGPRH